jgi:tryptophanyl-tRNA synthetase
MEYFEPMRARREELASRPHELEDILADGVARARAIASPVLAACREAAGLGPAK